jgi:hypothetical protein
MANVDIYFDDLLLLLGDPLTINLKDQVLTILKWRAELKNSLSLPG